LHTFYSFGSVWKKTPYKKSIASASFWCFYFWLQEAGDSVMALSLPAKSKYYAASEEETASLAEPAKPV